MSKLFVVMVNQRLVARRPVIVEYSARRKVDELGTAYRMNGSESVLDNILSPPRRQEQLKAFITIEPAPDRTTTILLQL